MTKKGDMEQLGQLVEIQRAKNADDLLAHSYSALISAHQGRYQQAIEIIEKADSPDVESDATWQRNYGQQIVVSWIVKRDHWRACLAEAGSSSPVYKAFLTELNRNERNSEVRELLTRHEVLDLPLEDRFPVLIEQLRNSQNDAEMIRVCELMRSLALKQLPNYEATRIYMAWLRACIRSNDLVEANRIGELLYADHDNECGKLFLSVVQRDFRKASELVPQLDNARWSMREFFWCEEMRPLREDPAFHDLNKKLAPYLEDHFGQHFTSILTTTPVKLTLEKVQRTLVPTGLVTESASQLNAADFNFDGDIFLFSLGDQKGMISASTTRWSPSESAELSTSERQAIETAKGELTVTLFDPERLVDSSRVSYELARELSYENATCAYAYPNMLLLCPTSESAIRTLPGFDEFTKRARIEYLDLNTNLPQPGDYGTQEYWSRSHRNQQLVVAVESGEAPSKFQVKVAQKFQKFSEKLWMDVLEVDDLETEYPMLICRLSEDSKVSPYLSKNTIWSVSLTDVIEWRERE